MSEPLSIRIGTRSSVLALAQAHIVQRLLETRHPSVRITLVPMVTTGDIRTDRPLADIGGKGLFTKELEENLLDGRLDIAVHSLKDMETHLRDGMTIGAVLERDDPRDAMVSASGRMLAELPAGSRIGTSSLRRAAQLRIFRPDLEIIPIRGNVTTRLAKLKAGEADAILLAYAGLKRIGRADVATEILETGPFIPAAGQGTIAVECRAGESRILAALESIHHAQTYDAVLAERSLLATLDGSCRTPIGGYARMTGGRLRLDAMIAKEDGSFHLHTSREGAPADAVEMGREAGLELLARGGRDCIR
jgi:hydroxymethylbilane synthase